jgi:hypothetical protein
MTPWQDDQTLFFKLQHLSDKAGYFGTGSFGVGVYKYIITPFIPVYYLFGLNTVYYYALALFAYFVASFSVYKTFSGLVNEKMGKVSGLLFAAGFVSSDSFIRLFNSVVTSLSVIFVGLFALFYWKYHKIKKVKWYFLAFVLFLSAMEFVRTRTHYLISLPLLIEFLFLIKGFTKKKFKFRLIMCLARVTPFIYVFYYYFIKNADSRSGNIREFITFLLKGDFSVIYGFLSSITNIIIPDWFSAPLVNKLNINYIYLGLFVIVVLLLYKFANRKFAILLSILFILWFFVSKQVFSTSILNLNAKGILFPFVGGVLVVTMFIRGYSLKNEAKILYLFLLLWMLSNLIAYSAYNPTLSYGTIHRYLTHSFLPFVGILGLETFISTGKKSNKAKLILIYVAFWGIGNLINSFIYQRNIILTRSKPVKEFYHQLGNNIIKLEKGDLIYFDVADESKNNFSDAFSVASMPEETAIAWRYGIDRYDIRRFTEFDAFIKTIEQNSITDINNNKILINNVYSFFYSKDGLVETTDQLKRGLEKKYNTEKIEFNTKQTNNSLEIEFNKPIKSVTPINLSLEIKANPPNTSNIKFPFMNNQNLAKNPVAKNDALRQKAFNYQKNKNLLYQNYNITTSSIWKEDLGKNMVDNRIDTYWRADRVLWSKEGAFFTIDIGSIQNIDRFVWINGYANNTPTKYTIETSVDNKNWKTVFNKESSKRIEPNVLNVDKFDSISAQYVRMTIQNTLSNDSASIAEAWIVPIAFNDLDIAKTEEFLTLPFGYVPNIQSYQSTLVGLNYFGDIQVLWLGNKSKDYKTQSDSIINIKYDNVPKVYNTTIPAGGTEITKLKLSQQHIIGELEIKNIFIK